MSEIQENNKNEAIGRKKNITTLTIVAIIAIAGAVLYYFFLYQPKIPQHQTFSFVSGDVVGKDDVGRTITVMAADGQLIPPGIRKTFYITDEAVIQRIIPPETENQGQAAVFKEADFGDIKIGDSVVVQGEFTTDTTEEKMASAVSILPKKPGGENIEFEPVVAQKSSNVPSSLYGTITGIGPGREVVVRAEEKQIVPAGSLRTVTVSNNTVIQKLEPESANNQNEAANFRFTTVQFSDLAVGQKVSVQSDLKTDITKQNSFGANLMTIMIGDF